MGINPIVTFDNDDETKKAILKGFDLEVNIDNIIVDSKTKEPALSKDGLEIPLNKFGGIWPGSRQLLRTDIVSLMDFAESIGK